MAVTIKVRRGLQTNVAGASLADYEAAYTTDTKRLYIYDGTNKVLIGGAAGNNTEIPFNDGGEYGSYADFTFSKTNEQLGIGIAAPTAGYNVHVQRPTGNSAKFLADSLDTGGGTEAGYWVKHASGIDGAFRAYNGGVAVTSLTTDQNLLLETTGTGVIQLNNGLLLGNATKTTNGIIRWTGSDFEGRKAGAWASLTASAGVSAPGADTQVVYNAGGAWGASANFRWQHTIDQLYIRTNTSYYPLVLDANSNYKGIAFQVNSVTQGNIYPDNISGGKLYYSAGDHWFNSLGGNPALWIDCSIASVNYWHLQGSLSGQALLFYADGSDANINGLIRAKGTGMIQIEAQAGSAGIARFQASGGAVGHSGFLFQSASAAGTPLFAMIDVTGSGATNISCTMQTQGNAGFTMYRPGAGGQYVLTLDAPDNYGGILFKAAGTAYASIIQEMTSSLYYNCNTQVFRNYSGYKNFQIDNSGAVNTNYWRTYGAATNLPPVMQAVGSDANVWGAIYGQGTAGLYIANTASGTATMPGWGYGIWMHPSNTGACYINAYSSGGSTSLYLGANAGAAQPTYSLLIANNQILIGINTSQLVGFHGAAGTARTAITGSKGGNAALANLIAHLASKGLITDSTT